MTAAPIRLARSALVYIALAVGVVGEPELVWFVGAPATLAAITLAWPQLNRVPRVLIAVALTITALALITDASVLGNGLLTLNRLAALIVAVMLLAHVLGESRHLAIISEHLFTGRASSRYLSITFGTLFLAMPLNFGSVSMISALIGREIESHGDSPGTRNATRAVLRGFGSSSMCSPLSIAVVLTLTLLPGIGGLHLIALTLPLGAMYLASGLVFRERETPVADGQNRPRPDHILTSWLFFAACIGAICLSTLVLRAGLGLPYAQAVTCGCLLVVALGVLATPGPKRLPRLDDIGNELGIIATSAFLGATLSVLVSARLGADFDLPVVTLPLIALGLPWLLFGAGMIGINPLIPVTLVGGLASRLWPADAGLGLAVAMVCGWGLTITGTPYSANALLVKRLTGYDNHRTTVGWSLCLSLIALTLASGLAAALTAFQAA